VSIGVGYSGACARVDGGYVLCWGANGNGQLGTGASIATLPSSTTPVVVNVQGAGALHVGAVHSCATVAGAVRCWGGGGAGQLGNGVTGHSTTPVAVSNLTDVAGLGSGMGNTCAVTAASEVWCWGDNGRGQLGDGTTTSSAVPVQVSGITDALDVSSSLGGHTCAVRLGGSVDCWGRNDEGQLGDGTTTDATTPVAVSGLSTAETVSTGNLSTCALRSDDTVACWGRNDEGQLGDGTTTDSGAPVDVSGITDAAQVAVGGSFACALVGVTPSVGGSVVCWGQNADGQLGDGTTTDSSTPVSVSGVSTAVAIAVGYKSACALLADGSVTCWGDDSNGQLGDGTTTSSNVPVVVTDIP
jgi:alpha-tubulin suppressor-like RCC1 family protein